MLVQGGKIQDQRASLRRSRKQSTRLQEKNLLTSVCLLSPQGRNALYSLSLKTRLIMEHHLRTLSEGEIRVVSEVNSSEGEPVPK